MLRLSLPWVRGAQRSMLGSGEQAKSREALSGSQEGADLELRHTGRWQPGSWPWAFGNCLLTYLGRVPRGVLTPLASKGVAPKRGVAEVPLFWPFSMRVKSRMWIPEEMEAGGRRSSV